MDEVFHIVKQQIELEKAENAKILRPGIKNLKNNSKSIQKTSGVGENNELANKQINETKKRIGTFGTSERKTFVTKNDPVDFLANVERPFNRLTGGYISKIPRAKAKEKTQEPQLILNPNYDYCKKKAPAPIVDPKPFKKVALKEKKIEPYEYLLNEFIENESLSVSTAETEFSDFFKEKSL